MESNKDEALRCVEIAMEYEEKGEIERAMKFYTKSINLYPTDEARNRLSKCNSTSRSSSTSSTQGTSPRTTSTSSTHSASKPQPTETKPEYTPEQKLLVDRVNRCKDYYEILEVSKTATEEEIKKKYKKIALQLHPDKNNAPGAEDAFKKVGQAFSCLNDASKRRMYDVRGTDSEVPTTSTRHAYDGDISPEDLFEMFFTGMHQRRGAGRAGPAFRTYTYRTGQAPRARRNNDEVQESAGFLLSLLQFLPIIFLILYAFIGGSVRESPFELQRSSAYPYQQSLKIGDQETVIYYYVKPDFKRKYSSSAISQIEEDVVAAWLKQKKADCMQEQVQKNRLSNQARYYDGSKYGDQLAEKLRSFRTPACDALEELGISTRH